MADINERDRRDNDADKTVGSGVGAFPRDTIASALDPFGTAAGAIGDEELDNKAKEAAAEQDNHGSKAKD